MNLYIDNKGAENSIGFFFTSLRDHISQHGARIVEPHRADAILCGPTSLVACKWMGRKKIIQRLDGIYFNADEMQSTLKKNADIRHIYTRADGIIFQSQYSKNMVESLIGECRKPNQVILNGADIKPKYTLKAANLFPEIVAQKQDGYTIFLGAAAWRPVKRPETILNGFLEYRKTHPKTLLYLAGDNMGAMPEGIICLGKLSHRNLLGLYSLIDLLINLSFSDACPNVVVEALYAKKPILASSNQGSAELYGGNGYIIQEPFKWQYNLISYNQMPQIPPQMVSEGIERALLKGYAHDVDVSMATCAARYKSFIESVSRRRAR